MVVWDKPEVDAGVIFGVVLLNSIIGLHILAVGLVIHLVISAEKTLRRRRDTGGSKV